ncbi:MAG: DNA adenine methylase [Candidatus Cloacimonadales bacterium]
MAKNKLVLPVVKWVGGKRQLLPQLRELLPLHFSTYFEPFVGGGALLFDIQPPKAIINDYNSELINVYNMIKIDVELLITDLEKHLNTPEYFYELRSLDREQNFYNDTTPIQRASRILYLNKTCFNGLFRVNQAGEFNAPFGFYKNPNIINKTTLRAVSNYFNKNDLRFLNEDFESSLKGIRKGAFVYFDPPYDPLSTSSNFTGYTQGGFKREDQQRLKELCDSLDAKGVKFLLSNSATEFIKDIYKGYKIIDVKARRSINSDGSSRGEINEVLVRNYE